MGQKHDWIILLPDQEDAYDRRMKIRPEHFKNLQPLIDSGFLQVGGGFLSEPQKEGEPPKLIGSFILAEAESKEEILDVLKKDVYTSNDVWDWDKAQIYPFIGAVRKGKP